MRNKDRALKVENFHQLHRQSSTFVLPNAWDAVSAKMFEESGFTAIGTTSAGIAAALGFKDGENIPLQKMIDVISSIVDSVNIPVSADIESGYGGNVKEVVETARKIIESGAVGINIEDGTGNPDRPLCDLSLQMEKIAAIKRLSDSKEDGTLFINARTDTYWLNIGDPSTRLAETIKRAKWFEESGADCIFIPGLFDREIIQNLRKEISCPINLLAGSEIPSLPELSNIGIERLSCGSGPFRATVTLLKTISDEIMNQQTFHRMTDGVLSYEKVSKIIQ
ncbi:isocitrate lyase/phosphoenolpyruvate mutase family protein [Halobacillus salinarum]|uniref:Isocitrate lyase/phosphoenolpyruvate mutase family protein n=1 Tax=Halobacillus salinarum TaxID=2932257 RepID=A0ABY4EH00_9BACI|nr:isocitrate lyase/phosphoenolpyruvate mutase family protein [Halobacillus salinarum]UOQ43750.1 isocitrate lyase/phosphoenolpyruvate mutase family protein [Halobacillus salinarum]